MTSTRAARRPVEPDDDLDLDPGLPDALRTGIAVGVAVDAALLWWAGCVTTRTDRLGPWGLLPELPAVWWGGAALAMTSLLLVLLAPRLSRGAAALSTGVLGLVLYATPALVEPSPHYTYVYKHLGVTRYVLENGTVDPAIDIYHRWPAAFALGAYVTELTGLGNPVRLAALTEPVLSLVVAALVMGIASRLGLSERTAWVCGAFTLVLNWVGQAYYAPQGLALVLALTVALLLAPHLRATPFLVRRLLRRWPALVGRDGPEPSRPGVVLLVVVVALHAAVVASHQLTPYVLLLGVGPLVVLGLLRTWLLVPALVVLTLAYLVPNYAYLDTSFGVLQGFDPLGHVRSPVEESGLAPVAEKVWLGRAALALHLLMWLTTLVALLVMLARGRARTALTVGVLAFSPALLLVLQSYGGEARLRVFLFSVPWCAIALGWFAEHCRAGGRRLLAPVLPALLVVFGLLFVSGFYGNEDLNTVPAGEVVAAEALYAAARPGSVVMTVAQGFPERYGPGYPAFPLDKSDLTPALLRPPAVIRELQAGAPGVAVAVREMQQYAPRGYLVFSTSQERYVRAFQLLPDGGYDRLERAVAASPQFRRTWTADDVRIYELVGR